jgi:hypothetical protein
MKEVYKQRVNDTLDATEARVKVITEMMNGERPVNQEDAKRYIKEISKALSSIREIIDIS